MVTLYPQLSIHTSSGAEGTILTRKFSSCCSPCPVERSGSKALLDFNSKTCESNGILRKSLCHQPRAGAEIAGTPPVHLVPPLPIPAGLLQHIFLPFTSLSSFPLLFSAFSATLEVNFRATLKVQHGFIYPASTAWWCCRTDLGSPCLSLCSCCVSWASLWHQQPALHLADLKNS